MSQGGKLRLVPPAGKYATPFLFAAYMTGGDGAAGNDASDHGPMLFSPQSSSPSGYYESGGLTNPTHSNDIVAKDCTLLLTVTEMTSGTVLVSAQEAPLGKKLELSKGKYKVSAQLLSFGGRVFASCDAMYDVGDTFDAADVGHPSSSSIYDTLDAMHRNNGLPPHSPELLFGQRTAQTGGVLQSTTTVSGIMSGKPHAVVSSSNSVSAFDQIQATVRQSEEQLAQTILNPPTTHIAHSVDVGRLSRSSSMTSQQHSPLVAAGAPRPPLARGGTQGAVQPSNDNTEGNSAAAAGGVDAQTASSSSALVFSAATDRMFVMPPPSIVPYGQAVSFAIAVPHGEHRSHHLIGQRYIVNTLVQEEDANIAASHPSSSEDAHGSPSLSDGSNNIHSAPVIHHFTAVRSALPVPARGVVFHWNSGQSNGGASGAVSAKIVPRGQNALGLSCAFTHMNSDKDGSAQQPIVCSASTHSTECIGLTSDDSVISGVQFSLAPPTVAAALLLISFRPLKDTASSDALAALSARMPYLSIELGQQTSQYRLAWLCGVCGEHERNTSSAERTRHGGDSGDVTLYESFITPRDVVSMFCGTREDCGLFVRSAAASAVAATSTLRHGSQQQNSVPQPPVYPAMDTGSRSRSGCFVFLLVNHVMVAALEIPQQVLPTDLAPLQVVAIARAALVTASAAKGHASPQKGGAPASQQHQPHATHSLLQNIVALSHHRRMCDLVLDAEVVGTVVETDSGSHLNGRFSTRGRLPLAVASRSGPPRSKTLYCWRRGESLRQAVEARILFVPSTAVESVDAKSTLQ